MNTTDVASIGTHQGLESLGIQRPGAVFWTPSTSVLYEQSILRHEAEISDSGPLVVSTGRFTGRTPKDKFIVREPSSEDRIWWEGNKEFSPEAFDALQERLAEYFEGRDIFVQDCYVGADADFQLPVRVVTEYAWHSLFVRNLFIDTPAGTHFDGAPGFTVLSAPGFHSIPERDGTRSDAFVILNFAKKLILIGGTEYAGEIKKCIFTVMHYLLPIRDALSMHCSANQGKDGATALFFGLSGTGKTTLSTNPNRALIGDDEHGWDNNGIFNFEGGCYAKVIRLSKESEPEIYQTTEEFGTLLENVVMNPISREVDFDDDTLTENTRAAYTLSKIENHAEDGTGGHPRNVVFLTADAFGVLPPISRLTPEQAMYHFISGYTAKVAGTEVGLTEPEATFSTCFGAPFLALPPSVYAKLLGEMVVAHNSTVWLVNTGWIGGSASTSDRVPIAFTRAMVDAVLSGALLDVPAEPDPIFGVLVPESCPGVPQNVLNPRKAWSDPDAYDAQARKLAQMFARNFEPFAGSLPAEVAAAGPHAE